MTHHNRAAALAAATLAAVLAAGPAAASSTTTLTTVMYESQSSSPDIDVSCKDFSVASTGVLSATCNYEDPDDKENILTKATTIDLDNELGCDDYGALSWQETDLTDDSTGIAIELDTTGRDLWVKATCTNVDPNKTDGKALDEGLDNDKGKIKRGS